jgi:hypothetical protein
LSYDDPTRTQIAVKAGQGYVDTGAVRRAQRNRPAPAADMIVIIAPVGGACAIIR